MFQESLAHGTNWCTYLMYLFTPDAGTHLYTWVERGTVRVKCLAQEHNTVSPARTCTWTTRSGVERTNNEATAQGNPAMD